MSARRLLADESLRSLLAVFATIVDPRSKQGHRYDLPYLLTCLVAALLCNCDSTLAVGQWCRDQRDLLEQLFGPRRFLCPSDSLYRRLLPCLSAEQLEWAIADWVRATLQAAPDEPIALDGKTIRGAKQDGHSGPHLVSFCTHQSQEILPQMRVGDKTNEIPVAHLLLPLYWLRGTSIPKKDGFGLPSFVFWVTFLERMYEVANTLLPVLPLVVVDNSNISPNRLTAWENRRILAFRGALPAPDFKQRGFVWPLRCSCSCWWSVSFSLWRCFGGWTGSRFGLPPHEEGPSAASSPASLSRAAQTTALPVVSPPHLRRVEDQDMLLYAPGLR